MSSAVILPPVAAQNLLFPESSPASTQLSHAFSFPSALSPYVVEMAEQQETADETFNPLISHLKDVLLDLSASPYPRVANPPGAERRASVALILRIQPNYHHWPSSVAQRSASLKIRRRSSAASDAADLSLQDKLDAFFRLDWVKNGDPEVLFIKRAARKGDRWTSHVALPGGRRDPEDQDDQVTAVREAMEEVGIDLSYHHAIAVGNLPQRVVTTSWGKVPYVKIIKSVEKSPHN
jgi:hypothetical protein